MFKVFGALLLVAASVVPAQAATSIYLSPAGTTTLPIWTNATIIQSFATTTATAVGNVTTISPTTNIPFAPGSPKTFDQAVRNITNGGQGATTTTASGFAGTDGQYLRLGSNSSYTISFDANPVAFFSFVFSNLLVNSEVTLNYRTGAPLILGSPASIVNVARARDVPAFGRVVYDVGSGSRITSVVFRKTGNNGPFVIDSIAAAAPEPAIWLMMILGFGIVGSALRRRQGARRGGGGLNVSGPKVPHNLEASSSGSLTSQW